MDLRIPAGETGVLLGKNGAGKSTILRILLTLVRPDSGHARVAGIDVVQDDLAARRAVGFVIGDGRAWHWRLSGRQNLQFHAAISGVDRRSARERIADLLERFDLTGAADRRVGEYSSGMRLRLGLCRAFLSDPHVLLLDEPTSALDPVAAREFRAQLVELRQRHEITALIATHDLREAAEIADRTFVMHDGQVRRMFAGEHDADELERALLELDG